MRNPNFGSPETAREFVVEAVGQRLALPLEECTAPRRNGKDPKRLYVTAFR